MKLKNVLLVIVTVGVALIPLVKKLLNERDEFDATEDLFI